MWETALPSPSTTQKYVVWAAPTGSPLATSGLALSVLMRAACLAAYSLDRRPSMGTSTQAGSAMYSLSAKASFFISTIRWMRSDELQSIDATSNVSSMFSISSSTRPGEFGGCSNTSTPR